MAAVKNSHVDLENARVDEQRGVMSEIIKAGHCPFCKENLEKYHKQPIIKQGKYWLITTNQWPYEHTRQHFLLIAQEHITDLAGLDPEAGKELFQMIQWLEKEYQVPGGGMAMRFGDTDYSAGSVAHLHVQFVVPELSNTDFRPVRIKIGKSRQTKAE